MFFYYATGISPAMAMAKVGSGSAYAAAVRDAAGDCFDGGKTYKVTLPVTSNARNSNALGVERCEQGLSIVALILAPVRALVEIVDHGHEVENRQARCPLHGGRIGWHKRALE